MKNIANTIEDLLEILAGLQGQAKIQIESSDATIMYSIARQVFKGIALTDRQFALMKDKLQIYRNQFTALDYDFDRAVDTLRLPLRHIDRSKYIKIVDTHDVFDNQVYESYKSKWKWIKVRFPFSKKMIMTLDYIPKKDYYHEKGSHEHYYRLTEQSVYNIIKSFKDKEFKIDQLLIDMFNTISKINNEKEKFVPSIVHNKIVNCNPRTIEHLTLELGEPTNYNLFRYKDRSLMYGIHHFDINELEDSLSNVSLLTKKIINRTKSNFLVNSNEYSFDSAVQSLFELERFPLLVVIGSSEPLEQLKFIHTSFNNIDNLNQSVLFRLDNNQNKMFNDYVKDNNINNSLDKNTEIVYISNDKLPKTLFKSNINFKAVLLPQSFRNNNKVRLFLNNNDFIMHYDSDISPMMRNDICQLVN